MLPELIFASHNPGKTREIAALLNAVGTVRSLSDIGFTDDIIENGSTLRENAWIKANTIFDHTGLNCFADDTGLHVEYLNGEPGIHSARYAGPNCNSQDNMVKLLEALKYATNRNACFITVICLIFEGHTYYFEGRMDGRIISEQRGEKGFGYDPVFCPDGSDRTLAEMSMEEKNRISHRAKAFDAMFQFLKQQVK